MQGTFLYELWVSRWALLQGTGATVLISLLAIVLGTILGVFVGLVLVYGRRASRFGVRLYVDFVRGTPVFVLVLASFYLLTQIGIQLTAFQAGLVALVVFCSTHVGENLRGALQSLPRGQTEAAKAIGLTEWRTRVWVIIPVMLRNAFPSLANNFIALFKDTSLAAAIAVPELTFYARKINTETFRVIEVWLVVSLMYVAACYLIAAGLRFFERRLAIPR